MSNSLTYKEISKILDLVETEIFKLENRKQKESSFHAVGSVLEKDDARPMEWEVEDRRLDADMSLLAGIKDKIIQLFERINFTFGMDNNRFNQPSQPNKEPAPNGQ
jgi:hypothetical protein